MKEIRLIIAHEKPKTGLLGNLVIGAVGLGMIVAYTLNGVNPRKVKL